jgi:hypothetical protein
MPRLIRQRWQQRSLVRPSWYGNCQNGCHGCENLKKHPGACKWAKDSPKVQYLFNGTVKSKISGQRTLKNLI